jgi:hypothetical protein
MSFHPRLSATRTTAAAIFGVVALGAVFLLGAYNSFDYWRQQCGLKISTDLMQLGV